MARKLETTWTIKRVSPDTIRMAKALAALKNQPLGDMVNVAIREHMGRCRRRSHIMAEMMQGLDFDKNTTRGGDINA